MTISFPTNIPPPERVKEHLDNLMEKLDHFIAELCLIESSGCFKVSLNIEQPAFTKVIVIPIKESVTYSKVRRSSEKNVNAYIINGSYECTPIRFSGDGLTLQCFHKKLTMF